MNLDLQEKVAVVTGGASGIGEAIVRLFAAEGMSVVVADRDGVRAEMLAKELSYGSVRVLPVPGDLTMEDACQRVVHETLRELGRLDVLVNNAGVNDAIGLDRSPSDFKSSLQQNLFPAFAITHFAKEALQKSRGSIVNIGSKVAVTGQGSTSGYAAAKGAINALTREWAVALAPHGVRVNCVVPAECDTPQYEHWFQAHPDPSAARHQIEQLVPLGQRLTEPGEIAAMVVFLSSPRSSHTTGQIIFVDGGYAHLDRAVSHDHAKWA